MAENRRIIFPSEITENLTHEFIIPIGQIGLLRMANLSEGDCIKFESYIGDECDGIWVPVVFCCKPLQTKYPATHMLIPIPGRYRAYMTNVKGDDDTDPTHFDDVVIEFITFESKHDLSDFYQLCC